eukprot:1195378-Prorocentrum_minimum.AAC.1
MPATSFTPGEHIKSTSTAPRSLTECVAKNPSALRGFEEWMAQITLVGPAVKAISSASPVSSARRKLTRVCQTKANKCKHHDASMVGTHLRIDTLLLQAHCCPSTPRRRQAPSQIGGGAADTLTYQAIAEASANRDGVLLGINGGRVVPDLVLPVCEHRLARAIIDPAVHAVRRRHHAGDEPACLIRSGTGGVEGHGDAHLMQISVKSVPRCEYRYRSCDDRGAQIDRSADDRQVHGSEALMTHLNAAGGDGVNVHAGGFHACCDCHLSGKGLTELRVKRRIAKRHDVHVGKNDSSAHSKEL